MGTSREVLEPVHRGVCPEVCLGVPEEPRKWAGLPGSGLLPSSASPPTFRSRTLPEPVSQSLRSQPGFGRHTVLSIPGFPELWDPGGTVPRCPLRKEVFFAKKRRRLDVHHQNI